MKVTILFSFTLLIAALVLTESSLTPIESRGVTQEFMKIGDKFYYIEEVLTLNWFAAAHKCIEFGGHLASLQSQKEHDALKAHLNPNRDYWIDINDLGKEGQFMSLTTGRKPNYLKWHPGNPGNYDENCGGLWKKSGTHLMNDFQCNQPLYFICEP